MLSSSQSPTASGLGLAKTINGLLCLGGSAGGAPGAQRSPADAAVIGVERRQAFGAQPQPGWPGTEFHVM